MNNVSKLARQQQMSVKSEENQVRAKERPHEGQGKSQVLQKMLHFTNNPAIDLLQENVMLYILLRYYTWLDIIYSYFKTEK